ncbi:hypothetical protein FK498_16895, partial [Elioraea sp. Yellowstone]|uniref:pilus assembly protein N-terminal domain-containing protein n=1 Tax=Elioraea sp. Yellowstone TaxID=2592070 RepID=UPI00116D8862
MILRLFRRAFLAGGLMGAALAAVPPGAPAALAQARGTLQIEVGGGQLVTLPQAASTVFAADPRIARVQAASPTTLFVSGVGRGRTVVVATAADGAEIATYEVVVGPAARPAGAGGAGGLGALEAAIRAAVPT